MGIILAYHYQLIVYYLEENQSCLESAFLMIESANATKQCLSHNSQPMMSLMIGRMTKLRIWAELSMENSTKWLVPKSSGNVFENGSQHYQLISILSHVHTIQMHGHLRLHMAKSYLFPTLSSTEFITYPPPSVCSLSSCPLITPHS